MFQYVVEFYPNYCFVESKQAKSVLHLHLVSGRRYQSVVSAGPDSESILSQASFLRVWRP